MSLSTSIWVETYKYLRFCSSGIVGDQMGFQPSAPQGFVFHACACVCVICDCAISSSSRRRLWSLINENWSYKETSLGFFIPTFLGLSYSCFQEQFLSWLKAAAHDKWMCLSVLQMLVCGRVCVCAQQLMEELRGAQEAGCYIFCQMSSMYLKPCVKDSCVCINVKRVCVYLCVCVCVCVPVRLEFFSAKQLLAQIFSFHVHGKKYKSCTTQSLVKSAAWPLLNKSKAITEHNPFHILWLLRKMRLLRFKILRAVPPHCFFFLTWTSNYITLRAFLEMWFHLSGRT